MANDLRSFVRDAVRLHPRIAHQGLLSDQNALAEIVDKLPVLSGFRQEYVGAIAVVDWDHKMPSEALVLRIFGYYSQDTLTAGRNTYAERTEEITAQDKFPEFDVPDFDCLFSDDAYECELELDGTVGACRLVSGWRREITPEDSTAALQIAKSSFEYDELVHSIGTRPSHFGELEAVSWTPPCESSHENWCLDVWYLLSFDGRVGTGKSFLVDLDDHAVISVRDFSVRAN